MMYELNYILRNLYVRINLAAQQGLGELGGCVKKCIDGAVFLPTETVNFAGLPVEKLLCVTRIHSQCSSCEVTATKSRPPRKCNPLHIGFAFFAEVTLVLTRSGSMYERKLPTVFKISAS